MRHANLKRSLGFTYIGLMLVVAIAGIALAGVGIVWKTEMQRENEKELRFVGEQYVAAIASYYECKVCGSNQLPKNLKDLLKDTRSPALVRHIRKLYRDPMTNSNDWGLIKSGDRIKGVYSKSRLEPLAKAYDGDLVKKKKDANQLGVNGNSTPNSANLNNPNLNNPLGTDNLNNSNNKVGNNSTDPNKSNTSKLDALVKPRKPSYQDWQFVYGGGGVEIAPQSQPNNQSPFDNNQNSTPDSPQNRQSVLETCQPTYHQAVRACRAQQFIDKDNTAAMDCINAAKLQYEECGASTR